MRDHTKLRAFELADIETEKVLNGLISMFTWFLTLLQRVASF